MTAYFSSDDLKTLSRGRSAINEEYRFVTNLYLLRKFRTKEGRDHATHGFCRRSGILVRAIDMVYDALPPDMEEIPERVKILDATIALQSFVLNILGCLDNLAWIWVYEMNVRQDNGMAIPPGWIGLRRSNRLVRRSLPEHIRCHLESIDNWLHHIENFRDALSHRIPLYIPPYIVTAENLEQYQQMENASLDALRCGDIELHNQLEMKQRNLCQFRPWMTHSYIENSRHVVFHNQILNDWKTVIGIATSIYSGLT